MLSVDLGPRISKGLIADSGVSQVVNPFDTEVPRAGDIAAPSSLEA